MNDLKTQSLGEVNVWSESIYLANYDSSVDTAEWNTIGLMCGERYPNNVFTDLDFSGENFTNCSLHINGRLHTGWTGDCENITITTDMGWQKFRLTATSSLNNSVDDSCHVWTDIQDKELGDFGWLFIMLGVWCFMILVGVRYSGFMLFMAGVFGVFISYELIAYSMLAALVFFVLNVAILFSKK